MHAYLIVGNTTKEREEKTQELAGKLNTGHALILETGKSHTIEDIRNLQKNLSFAWGDQEKTRLVVVKEANLLTSEAANSFLKTLEEPPANTIIILTSPSYELVLETIVSRAQLIDLGPQVFDVNEKVKTEAREIFDKLIKGSAGEKLKFLESIKDREEALEFCALQVVAAREKMIKYIEHEQSPKLRFRTNNKKQRIKDPTPENLVNLIERLEKTREDLQNNVNVKLALGDLLLNYTNFFFAGAK